MIRELDLNNPDKKIARQSILEHREDLYNYIENYEKLASHQRLMSLELAQKRFNITQKIYENRESVLE